MDLIQFVVIMAVAYFVGTVVIEKKHYASLRQRERMFLNMTAVTAQHIIDENRQIKETRLVYGEVVVSIDYFKRFLGALRNLVGGEMSSFETVLDRGRREAILRMKESARGSHIILNMRLETSSIGGMEQGKGIGCSEIFAYGTAVTFADDNTSAVEMPVSISAPNSINTPAASQTSVLLKEQKSKISSDRILSIIAIVILAVIVIFILKIIISLFSAA